MKYSVKFYPEKRYDKIDKKKTVIRKNDPKNFIEIVKNVPVILSVTYSLKRMFYYTGQRCNIKQWDLKTSRLKINQITLDGKSSQEFNAELDKIKVAVDILFKAYDIVNVTPKTDQLRNDLKIKIAENEILENYKTAKVIPTPDQLRIDLSKKLGKRIKKIPTPEKEGFFDRFDKYIVDKNLSFGRKKHLKTIYNKLKAFNPNTTFDKLDAQYLTDFQNYLFKKISKNTTISELRCLRAFYGYANLHGWTKNQPFKGFEIGAESYGDPVYITVDERDKLFFKDIPNESLARVRDIFVFQCFIGCRVGDLVMLKKSNIINGCIEYIAGKTKDDKPRVARVPLAEKAKTILARYDEPDGRLLPFISDQKYNNYIKELFHYVKINRIVTVRNPKTGKDKQVSIADIASSHMARRVFIGGLFGKGVKDSIIASMSGHVPNSKAFSRYYKVEQADQQKAISLIE